MKFLEDTFLTLLWNWNKFGNIYPNLSDYQLGALLISKLHSRLFFLHAERSDWIKEEEI